MEARVKYSVARWHPEPDGSGALGYNYLERARRVALPLPICFPGGKPITARALRLRDGWRQAEQGSAREPDVRARWHLCKPRPAGSPIQGLDLHTAYPVAGYTVHGRWARDAHAWGAGALLALSLPTPHNGRREASDKEVGLMADRPVGLAGRFLRAVAARVPSIGLLESRLPPRVCQGLAPSRMLVGFLHPPSPTLCSQ